MYAHGRLPLRSALASLLLLAVLALAGCQSQKDAAAAAQQMATTSATLEAYYVSLGRMLSSTVEAQIAQSYLNGVPFDDETRAQYKVTRAEMVKRAEMARSVAKLSALFVDITQSKAAGDAAKAADDLNTELINLKTIKSNGNETEVLKIAVNALVNAIKTHDEIKAAKLMEPVAAALSTFFDAEADRYQATADSYYNTAASNSVVLIEKSQVGNGLLYRSSLLPFGLSPEITDASLKQTSQTDLKARVAERLLDHQHRDQVATADLSESLHVMRDRIAKVANGKPLRVALPPFTLDGVKTWIEDVKSDIGEK